MKKTVKKVISLLLCLMMVFTIIPFSGIGFSAFAIDSGTYGTNITWTFDADTGVLDIQGSGVMPNGWDIYPPWSDYESSIETVNIGEGITSIGAEVFYGFENLKQVNFPDTLELIDEMAFASCRSLESVEVPDSVKYIEYCAFADCKSLLYADIGDSVRTLNDGVFSGCQALMYVRLGNSLESIYGLALSECSSLLTLEIPASVTFIRPEALTGLKDLSKIEVDSRNKAYSSEDGVLFNKDKTELVKYPVGETSTEYTIPDTVTCIQYSAFEYSSYLQTVTVPISVNEIDESAFAFCNIIKDVYYGGTEEDWEKIDIGYYNDGITNATKHFAVPVAEVNGVKYTTLEEAAAKAPIGSTIKLLSDVTYEADGAAAVNVVVEAEDKAASVGPTYINLENVTLDLNGYTINANRQNPIFYGSDFTIKNGKVMTKGADYGLWIGGSDLVVVDGIASNAGIMVWSSSNVALKNNNVDATERDYYAVYTESTTDLLIESGSYIAKDGNKALYVKSDATATVTGGTFSNDVSDYLRDGYKVVENDEGVFEVREVVSGLLSLKGQTNKAGTQLRFITTIDTLRYKEVGFVITNADNPNQTITKTSKTVYSSIIAGGKAYSAAQISGDEAMNYILTYTITGIPAAAQGTRYLVKPFAVTLDGQTVYGAEKEFCVADMIA